MENRELSDAEASIGKKRPTPTTLSVTFGQTTNAKFTYFQITFIYFTLFVNHIYVLLCGAIVFHLIETGEFNIYLQSIGNDLIGMRWQQRVGTAIETENE